MAAGERWIGSPPGVLTGKIRHRRGILGALILQVEVKRRRSVDPGCCGWPEDIDWLEWRDATTTDLSYLLIDHGKVVS